MKILFCTNAFHTVSNGPAKFANILLDINQIPGHSLHVLTEDAGDQSSPYIHPLNLSIPRLLKPLGMLLRNFIYYRAAMKIRKNEFPYDILVYNNCITSIWSGLWFRNTIAFINDDTYLSAELPAWWNLFKLHRKHAFQLLEKIATRTTRATIVNSEYLRNVVISNYNADPAKVFKLYKGVKLPAPQHATGEITPKVLFVKNDYERGGLFVLISALRILNTPIELHVAGPPNSALPTIQEACMDSQVALTFHGIIRQEEVFELMRTSDVFCVPSFKEALGVANIEAMAHGCRIVSTQVGGIPEVLDNGKAGWLVPPGDPQKLAQALREALYNMEESTQKQAYALQAVKKYDKNTVIFNFLNILTSIG